MTPALGLGPEWGSPGQKRSKVTSERHALEEEFHNPMETINTEREKVKLQV